MAAVEGLTKLVEKLRAKTAEAMKSSEVSVVVGFETNYA